MPSSAYRALIVDDEPAIRKLLQRALRVEGFECETAEDGLQATELTQSQVFDLVVTDLAMPGQHGHSLAVHLLEQAERPLVVVLTGIAEPRLAKDLFARGVDDVVLKPVDFRMFAAKLRSLVDRKRTTAPVPAAVPVGPPAAAADHRPKLPTVDDLEERLTDVSQILPVSSVAFQVYNRCHDEQVPIAEIAALLARDGALVAEVLHHANLSLNMPVRKKILDVEQAVMRLGRQRVGEMAIASKALATMTATVLDWTNVRLLRKRSLAAGLALDSLIELAELQHVEGGLVAAAIMYSLDRIVLSTLYPKHYAAMLAECRRSGAALVELEHAVFAQSPSAVLARLLASWNLPGEIVLSLGPLRKPYSALGQLGEPVRTKSELLKLAILVGELAVGQWEPWDQLEFPAPDLLERLKLNDAFLVEAIHKTQLALEADALAGASPAVRGENANRGAAPHEVPYAQLPSATCDLLHPLLVSLGLHPVNNPAVVLGGQRWLVGGIGVDQHELADQLGQFDAGSVAVITDLPANAVPPDFDCVLSLPCSYGAFEAFAREHLLGENVPVAAHAGT